MQSIEITDPTEARRSRFAQYRGLKATIMLNGLPITGIVHSVKEHHPMRWTIMVVAKAAGRAIPLVRYRSGKQRSMTSRQTMHDC
jgi:hypothetical protein